MRERIRKWHLCCAEVWPSSPEMWCPACADAHALDMPRKATPAEMLAAAREAWEFYRGQQAAKEAT